jgi:hypothetical protein
MAAAAAAAAAQMAVNAFLAHLNAMAAAPAPIAPPAPIHHNPIDNFQPQIFINKLNPVPMDLNLENANLQIKRINEILTKTLDVPKYKTGLRFNIYNTEMTALFKRYIIYGEVSGSITAPLPPAAGALPPVVALHTKLSILWELKKSLTWSILTKSFETATNGYSHCNGHRDTEPFLAYQALCDFEQDTHSHSIDDKGLEFRASSQGNSDDISQFAARLTDGRTLLDNNGIHISDRELISIFIKGLHERHLFLKGYLSGQKPNHTPLTTFASVLQSAHTYSHDTKGFEEVILAMQSNNFQLPTSSNSRNASVSIGDDDICDLHKDVKNPHTSAQCYIKHPHLLAEMKANRKRKPQTQEARYKKIVDQRGNVVYIEDTDLNCFVSEVLVTEHVPRSIADSNNVEEFDFVADSDNDSVDIQSFLKSSN